MNAHNISVSFLVLGAMCAIVALSFYAVLKIDNNNNKDNQFYELQTFNFGISAFALGALGLFIPFFST